MVSGKEWSFGTSTLEFYHEHPYYGNIKIQGYSPI